MKAARQCKSIFSISALALAAILSLATSPAQADQCAALTADEAASITSLIQAQLRAHRTFSMVEACDQCEPETWNAIKVEKVSTKKINDIASEIVVTDWSGKTYALDLGYTFIKLSPSQTPVRMSTLIPCELTERSF